MKKIKVLAGGCFNKIHKGHVYFLKRAKALGYLIIVLAHDKNNKKSYGIKAKIRKKKLAELKIADRVIIGDAKDFSKVIKKEKPDILGMSALLTTTMSYMREVIDTVKSAPLKKDVKIIIGGAPITQSFADEIGADGYAQEAESAVSLVRALLNKKEKR